MLHEYHSSSSPSSSSSIPIMNAQSEATRLDALGLGCIFLGICSHHALFIRGEWHMTAPALVWTYLLVTCVIFFVTYWLTENVGTGIFYAASSATLYSAGLFTSIISYRILFHRLNSFPGPRLAAATKLWHVWMCRKGENHLVLERLRHEYGSFVRTGPEEITVFSPTAPAILDGPKNDCQKAVWYDFLLPEIAVNTTRNKQDHDARRRIWDRGFSPKALAMYEQRIVEYAELLAQRIGELSQASEPIVVTDWFYWFSFDVMGEFAFARSFSMLRDERWHFAIRMLRTAMSLLGPFSPVPWLAQIAFHFVPQMYLIRDWFRMLRWCKKRMEDRIQMKTGNADVSHWLIEASTTNNSLETDRAWLNGDAIAIIIAGSDTVAPALVFAFYELASNPAQQEKLFAELQHVDIYDRTQLQHCDHLNAVINETLRLHPPVPTGGYRQSSPAGVTIDGTYIPGNVTIVTPRYSLGRLESCFADSQRWIPERWTTSPELLKDARGFSPFSQGRYSCVGKTLAMLELRFVIALLVTRFEVGLNASDRSPTIFTDLRDQFTAAPGKQVLLFSMRSEP